MTWQDFIIVSNTIPETAYVEHIVPATPVRKWTLMDGVATQNHTLKLFNYDDSVEVYTALPAVLVAYTISKWTELINSAHALQVLLIPALSMYASGQEWQSLATSTSESGGMLLGEIIYG